MAVPVVNLVIEEGTDFQRTYSLNKSDGSPLDLSIYEFDVKMRKWSNSAGSISFGTTYNADPAKGQLTISLTNAQTGIITAGRYNYDIIIENANNNKKTKVITGQVKVNSTVS